MSPPSLSPPGTPREWAGQADDSAARRAVLVRSLHAFDLCPAIRHIVVVAKESAIDAVRQLCRQYEIDKLTRIVPGGDTRQESVLNGIEACPEDTEYYAIHDGARPLVTQSCIRAAIRGAVRYGAAAAGMHVKDTIKRIGAGGKVLKTPERDGLVAVQTPQVFRRELYHEAVLPCRRPGLAGDRRLRLMRAGGGLRFTSPRGATAISRSPRWRMLPLPRPCCGRSVRRTFLVPVRNRASGRNKIRRGMHSGDLQDGSA